MKQYIDKSALVVEIEKIIDDETESIKSFEHSKNVSEVQRSNARVGVLTHLRSFLDTIEAKEADSIWNDARKTIPEDSSNQIICIKEDDLAVATVGKIVSGTKKWAYLNDLLNIPDVQVKEEEEKFEHPSIKIKDAIEVSSRMKYIDEDLKPIADFVMNYASWNLHKNEWNHPVLEIPLFRVLDALAQRGKPYCCAD